MYIVIGKNYLCLDCADYPGDMLIEKPHTTQRFLPHATVTMLVITVVVVSLFGSGCIGDKDAETSTQSMKLQVTGSTTVLPIADECARVYMETHPGSRIYVSGGGSSLGIKSVADGIADIGTASRDLKDSENEKYPDLVLHAVAKDGVAIITHAGNPISNLTMEELQKIYTGEITNWKDLGGVDAKIMVVSREEGSGTRDCFEQAVLKSIKQEIMDYAVIQDSNGKIRTTVAGNKDGIGFISIGYINSDVRAVKLDDIEPTVENVQNDKYAISRTLWMLTNGDPDEDERAFLNFVLSDAGQKLVSDVHFIPVG